MTRNASDVDRPRLRLAAANGYGVPAQTVAPEAAYDQVRAEDGFVSTLRQLVGPACVRAFLDMFRLQVEALRRCPAQDVAQLVLQASEAQDAAAALGFSDLAEACAQLQTVWRSGRSLDAARADLRRAVGLTLVEVEIEIARGMRPEHRPSLRLASSSQRAD